MTKEFIENVIEVDIALGTQPLSTTKFNLPLLVAKHNVFGTRTQRYSSLKALSTAGFDSNSPVYKMATLIFNGVNAPDSVLVGRRAMTTAEVNFTPVNNAVYTLTLRSGATYKTFSYTADSTATAAEIATGLQTLIAADVTWNAIVTATVSTSKIVLTPVATKYFDVGVGANSTVTYNSTEDLTDTLTAITAENNNWFWAIQDSHVLADVKDLADWAQSNDKIYMWSSQDTAVRDKTAGNILLTMTGYAYQNTLFAMWAPDADSTFPEAGVIGAVAGQNIDAQGTDNLHGKTLTGVLVNSLTLTQLDNIVSSGGNVYVNERDVGFYRDGFVHSGDYLDTIVFSLWVKARTAESLSSLIKRQSDLSRGVRYNSTGLAQIKQAIYDSPVNVGIANGTISNETPAKSDGTILDWRPKIYIPSIADISADDLANRILNNVSVDLIYVGFINYVKVNVNISLRRS